MHKLNRAAVSAPTCLAAYQYPTHTWDDLGSTCKQELRAALVQMQGIPGTTTPDAKEYGLRCAYCEVPIWQGGHIEHFQRKNPLLGFPQLTFAWNNLFLACGSKEHCGHYKDHQGGESYNPADLIKPDQDDPEQFLYFHSSGEVRPRTGENISPQDAFRASETIRVFGLDNAALVGARHRAVKSYRKMKDADLQEIESWSLAERNAWLQEEIAATQWEAYATTIKHFLLA
jgi:uncharacterized protein (TIGR02646 family)